MSDELIEAVARAICRQHLLVTRQPDDDKTVAAYLASFVREARAAIAAIEASGFVVVPLQATPEMLNAGRMFQPSYAAMLSARPKVTR